MKKDRSIDPKAGQKDRISPIKIEKYVLAQIPVRAYLTNKTYARSV